MLLLPVLQSPPTPESPLPSITYTHDAIRSRRATPFFSANAPPPPTREEFVEAGNLPPAIVASRKRRRTVAPALFVAAMLLCGAGDSPSRNRCFPKSAKHCCPAHKDEGFPSAITFLKVGSVLEIRNLVKTYA